ncbi:AgmX/PglI C-terminal domain-containing protein [Teredinibacter haidensis]|uniref:AgmX/PglI C-terminal domain-containing protein n=1 Tax=Teredinibacter haidensis TaxID=2731755 RepID=UPI000948FDA3|nr:AgmX/PglI C-terminal domain-containing protein [Teredinibacter haidensis]
MQAAVQPLALELQLPWALDERQEKKFERILKRFLIPILLFMLVIPWLPVFELSYEEIESDEVVTTVMLKPLEILPPPPVPEKKVVAAKSRPVASEQAEQPKPSPKMAHMKEQKIVPKQDSKNALKQSQGLNELSNQLTALRGTLDLARLQTRNVTTSSQGEFKRNSHEFLGKDGAVKRSDGIEIDETLVVSNGSGLAAYQSTSVDGLGLGDSPVSTLASHSSFKTGQRDMESIRRTLERTKSSVHSLYQLALLDNPDLAGKFTFKLVIEPDGTISNLSLLASELGISNLESNILERIRSVNFGAKEVSPTVVEYKFVFLPS